MVGEEKGGEKGKGEGGEREGVPKMRATTGNDELINNTKVTFSESISIDICPTFGLIRFVIGKL